MTAADGRPAALARWTVVHDFAYVLAGAERVSAALANDVGAGAPLVAIAGDEPVLEAMRLRGGWRRLLPSAVVTASRYRALTPLYPLLLRLARPVQGDVVCSSYAFAHHVRCTGRKVVYCHTPLRQVWSGRAGYLEHAGGWQRWLLRAATGYLRWSDRRAAATADVYIASSTAVRDRVRACYGRQDVVVVAPPLDTSVFHPADGAAPRADFLWVGRVVEPYKRLEMTIEAFRGAPHRLLVAGDGRDRARLEAGAPPNVVFLGWQDDAALAELYRGALAVVFPSEDDFGLVPVESMACGTPSVAFAAGGARETVTEGVTGVFFDEQSPASLRAALDEAAARSWDHATIAAAGLRYGSPRFVAEVRAVLTGAAGQPVGGAGRGAGS